MAAVGALLIGVAPHVPGAAAAIAGRLGGSSPAEAAPPAATRELALAAARPCAARPARPPSKTQRCCSATCSVRLAAGQAIDEMAATILGPAQVGGDPFLPDTARAGRITAHVVTAAEETASRANVSAPAAARPSRAPRCRC